MLVRGTGSQAQFAIDPPFRRWSLTACDCGRELLHRARDLLARELAFLGEAGKLAQYLQRPAHRLPLVLSAGSRCQSCFSQARRKPARVTCASSRLSWASVSLSANRRRRGPAHMRPCLPRSHRPCAEVFQQHHAQCGGQCSQIGEAKLTDLLIGVEERVQDFGIEHAGGVGDVRPGDTVDARQAGQRRPCEREQLGVIAPGHAFPDLFELSFDQVEVIRRGRRV
jgi:hypothetical protein